MALVRDVPLHTPENYDQEADSRSRCVSDADESDEEPSLPPYASAPPAADPRTAYAGLVAQHAQTLRCGTCRAPFAFDAREQALFKQKGWHPPRTCPPCRRPAPPRDGRRRF